jgi:APA family basic amino acid/polyamine antiporter
MLAGASAGTPGNLSRRRGWQDPPVANGNLDAIVAQAEHDRTRLDANALGPVSLTALGIASVVGAGIFVTTGEAAARYAGPAVVFSFLIAGLAAGVTAL